MAEMTKGRSPFYPGQPVPVELFAGRGQEVDHIVKRGVQQVAAGKPVSIFVEGEYGIGKSSIAIYAQRVAEERHGLHGIYVSLGGSKDLEGVAEAILTATVRSGAYDPKRAETVRNLLAKYVGDQNILGFSLNMARLKADAPSVSSPHGLLSFVADTFARLRKDGVRGIILILDEINGISTNPAFAHLLKGLVDQNAALREPVPLLFMLCGTPERRQDLIRSHQPLDRLFDVVRVEAMPPDEVAAFFRKAFSSVGYTINDTAANLLANMSAGQPKIMHILGDAAFWQDMDGSVDAFDALDAIHSAADEVGRKFVDQQVYAALKSKDYLAILQRIGESMPHLTFDRKSIAEGLPSAQRGKLDNFLQRMKRMNVIRPAAGAPRGHYEFTIRMVAFYVWLQAQKNAQKRNPAPRGPVAP